MSEKNQNTHVLTNQTNDYLGEFESADTEFRTELQKFLDAHPQEVAHLEQLREARNKALDDVKQSLREDAKRSDYQKVKAIVVGKFKAQKKWSDFYNVEGFVQMVKNQGDDMYKSAVDAGAIQETTEVDVKKADAWLARNNLTKQFKQLKDGTELTPAIYGPKDILAFGEEVKK